MKKIFVMVIALFVGTHAFNQQKQFKDLVGRWEIVGEKEDSASLEVIDSSNIILSYMGERKRIIDYKIDFQKNPIWFDFSTVDSASSIVSVKSILEMVNDNMLKWQLFLDEDRTDHFSSSKGELFYLRKAKQVNSIGIVTN
jgi:hypothetical protein